MLDPLTRDAIQSRAVELLRTYLPSLKPQGRQWITLCPFHDDTTPSFVVSPEKGLFHCHGCKVGGDMLTFVQRFKRLSFPTPGRSRADAGPRPARTQTGGSSYRPVGRDGGGRR